MKGGIEMMITRIAGIVVTHEREVGSTSFHVTTIYCCESPLVFRTGPFSSERWLERAYDNILFTAQWWGLSGYRHHRHK
jgi:hypothetical protein